ncbi:MAG: 3'(2'),5'-bisphosphate nucleotidase CysQ family protein [Planctomycetota bacterium]|jgi:fructose-1,6-bisphosphatase/inositol monophosphatase family enzyme
MAFDHHRLTALRALAITAADDAAAVIESRAATIASVAVEHKAAATSRASAVVTAVDRAVEDLILERLAPSLIDGDIGVLAEERTDGGSRLQAAAFWAIDPIDGTLPFIEGRPGYALSIALVRRDGTPLVGVVCDPRRRELLVAQRGVGVWRNGQPWQRPAVVTDAGTPLRLYTDGSVLTDWRYPALISALENHAQDRGLGVVERVAPAAIAGAVCNAWQVCTAVGPACYVKFPRPGQGGGCVWDVAATACIASELGLQVGDIHGQPLQLNRADTVYMNHSGLCYANDVALAGAIQACYRQA